MIAKGTEKMDHMLADVILRVEDDDLPEIADYFFLYRFTVHEGLFEGLPFYTIRVDKFHGTLATQAMAFQVNVTFANGAMWPFADAFIPAGIYAVIALQCTGITDGLALPDLL